MQSQLLCLWLLFGCIFSCFALSLGLTWRSDHFCYAGVCGSWLFPLQARLHVGVWYAWLLISTLFLTVRATNRSVRTFLSKGFMVPWWDGKMTVGGLILVLWQAVLYSVLLVNWWPELHRYFTRRGEGLPGNVVVAFVAQSGHLADVTMGLVLLPVTRHGALAAFFKLQPGTNFLFHMTQAYLLFILVVIHGLSYAGWVALYNQAKDQFRHIFPVLNPTYLYHEVWPGNRSALATWRASLIFSGSVATLIMTAMLLTSFSAIRRKYFNLFYFTHLFGIVAVVVICLHASTMFYCTAPGLSMWLLDWGLRTSELRRKMDGRLKSLGKGWYSLTILLPHSRLLGYREVKSPLAHFHIHHSGSSKLELHPFTTTTHLASRQPVTCSDGEEYLVVEFLFREMEGKGSERPLHPSAKKRKQWTTRLASLVDDDDPPIDFSFSESEKNGCIGFPYQPEKAITVVNRSIHPALRSSTSVETELYPEVNSGSFRLGAFDWEESRPPSSSERWTTFSYTQAEDRGSQDIIDNDISRTSDEKELGLSSGSTTPSRYATNQVMTNAGVDLSLRLEGPYYTAANPIAFETVVCLVAGTGVTGAIAIASAFQAHRKHWRKNHSKVEQKWCRCVVVWSVRADDYVEIPVINDLQNDGLDFRICQTGGGNPRPDLARLLSEICGRNGSNSCWVYICGPGGFASSAERACMRLNGLSWCTAT